jgi:hypothetical protein
MGDRGNIVMLYHDGRVPHDTAQEVWLYTHADEGRVVQAAQDALRYTSQEHAEAALAARGRLPVAEQFDFDRHPMIDCRWDDAPYLARAMFQHLLGLERPSRNTTSYGIAPYCLDENRPPVRVCTECQTVQVRDHVYAFADFAAADPAALQREYLGYD